MIYIDGTIYENKQDAKISVYDHGLLYGDGIFEGIRFYHGRAFKLTEHLQRLKKSARAIRLDIPETMEEIGATIDKLINLSKRSDGYIRLNVTRGEGDLGLNPASCKRASLIIILDMIRLYPQEYYAKGVRVCTASVRRMPLDAVDPRVKSLNYLNNVLAKFDAIDNGCQEAIILNSQGLVAECTADNIFYYQGETLATPPSASGALEGVTRAVVMDAAKKMGVAVEERPTALYDLYNADECFLSGTGAEIVPVVSIDGRIIGSGEPGMFTSRIRKEFEREIEACCPPCVASV